MGANDHQPNQIRLQIAKISIGRTVKRVQTLRGLAWRAQVSSLMWKAVAILRSNVIAISSLKIVGALLTKLELHPQS